MGRLQCHCTFTDSAKKLAAKLDALSSASKPSYDELKATLELLRAEHHQHVTLHNQQYARAFVEYHRVDERPLLKTTAFSAGDVRRARDPVKKPGKGKRKGKGNAPPAAGGGSGEGTTKRKKKVVSNGGAGEQKE